MLTIDGSFGEGGGQIVRSSLALALVTGREVTIENVRARRKKPGLMRQHLTAVRAAAELSGAEVEEGELGSRRLVFRPGAVTPGTYRFDVGTAGSTTLVLQTVLPALLTASGQSELTLEGGTHNPMAPPFDFLARSYLPLVGKLGPRVEAELERPGFYPAGGGLLRVRITPAERLGSLNLVERGEITGRRVRAMVASLPRHIAERECRTIAHKSRWPESCSQVEEVRGSRGPGNAVVIELESPEVTEVFTGFGQRGIPAEKVAAGVWREAKRYLDAGVPVGEHLADQLMLPLGIAAHQGSGGGVFRTMDLTPHATTHAEVLRRFMDVEIDIQSGGRDDWKVRIAAKG